MSGFQIDYNPNGDQLKIDMHGNIDEDVIFDKYPLVGFKKIDINLANIKSINSCGIREWIRWFSKTQNTEINLIDCPRVMIEQFNMIDSVRPKDSKIISFFVPYYNEDLNLEKKVLYEFGKNFDENNVKIEETIKDESGNIFELDVVQTRYFQFLKYKK